MKTRAVIEQQIENLLVAQVMMQNLHPRRFVLDLGSWSELQYGEVCDYASERDLRELKCGAAACFGGWVAIEPHFQKQGVYRAADGAPLMLRETWSSDVARRLFGDETLFDSLRYGEEFGKGYTEKEAVLARINKALGDRLDELR